MESNEQTELTNKTETDSISESRIAAKVGWEERLGDGGIEQKEKGLVDIDNSVVIAGGGRYKGIDGSGKNTVKI